MTHPWDDIVSPEEVELLAARGNAVERETRFGDNPALVIVDMTRSFTDPGYPASCHTTGGEAATEAAKHVLDAARRAGIPIFFTKVLQTTPGTFLPVELGMRTEERTELLDSLLSTPAGLPEGNEIGELLEPRPGEIVISKPKPSAFHGTALDTYLHHFHTDSLLVTGMVTSGCVRATVIDAYMRNYHVNLIHQAVADYSPFNHKASLLDMHIKYADLTQLDDMVEHLRSRSPRVVAVPA